MVHTPSGRRLALGTLASVARSKLGVDLTASRLDYNLLTLSFALDDLRLDVPGDPTTTVTARRLELDLSSEALRGRLAADRLAAAGVGVTVHRVAGAPSDRAAKSTGTLALPDFALGRLVVDDLDVMYVDPRGIGTLVVTDVHLQAEGDRPRHLAGRFGSARGLSIATGVVAFVTKAIDGRFVLDDAVLGVDPLSVRFETGSLDIRGTSTIGSSATTLGVAFTGEAELAEVASWVPALAPADGRARFSGTVEGPLGSPTVSLEASGEHTALPWIRVADWKAAGTLDASGLRVDRLAATAPAGAIDGSGLLAFGDGRSSVDLSWTNVELARAPQWMPTVTVDLPRLRTTGVGRLEWPGSLPRLETLSGQLRASLDDGPGEREASGALSAAGRAGTWTLEFEQRLADSTEARATVTTRLTGGALADSPLEGAVAVTSRDVNATLRDLAPLGLPLPAGISGVTTGSTAIDGRLGGTLASPIIVANVDAQAVSIGGGRPLRVVGTLGLDRAFLRLDPLAATGPLGNTIEARGTVGLGTAPGQGTFTFSINELGRFAAAVPERWRPTGHLDVDGSWTGTLDTLASSVSLSSDAIDLADTRFSSLEGAFDISREGVTVHKLSLRQNGAGTIDLAGQLGFETRDVSITARVRGLDLVAGRTPADDPGRVTARGVSLDAEVSGTLSNPEGRVNVSADRIVWRDRDLGPLSSTVTADAVTARIDVEAPRLATTFDGSVQLAAPWAYEARADIRQGDLPALFEALGVAEQVGTASGRLTLATQATGSLAAPGDSEIHLTLESLDGQVRSWPLVLAGPSHWRLAHRTVTTDGLDMAWGPTQLTIEPQEDPPQELDIRGTLRARIEDVQSLLESPDPKAWTVNGAVDASFEAGGSLAEPRFSGRLTVADAGVARGEQAIASGIAATVETRDGSIELRQFTSTVMEGTVTASGRLPSAWLPALIGDAPAGEPVTADGGSLEMHAAIPVSGALNWLTGGTRAKVEGGLDVDLHLDASSPTLESLAGELVVKRASLVSGDLTVTQHEPARFSLANARIDVQNLHLTGPRSELAVEGFVSLIPERDSNLRLYGAGTLQLFDLFLPGLASGRAAIEAQVRGAAAARRVWAVFDLDNASLVMPTERLVFADWTGRLTLNQFGLEANSVTGQLNGGDITVTGFLPIGTDIAPPDPLSVRARAVLLEMPKGLRTETDADLSWRRDGDVSTLAGEVLIHSGAYREPVTQMIALVQTLTSRPTEPGTLPPWLEAMRLDVKVTASEPLRLDNSLASAELLPDLRLIGTVAEPALQGELRALENGRLTVGGRTYRMLDSEIAFSPATGITPTLNIQAETRVGDYEVFLRITGPPDTIETSLASNPPLGERDLRSLILTGRTSGVQGEASGGEAFAMGAISADILGFAGSFVGVDTVSFGQTTDLDLVATDVDPATRFTVTKSFGRQFEIILSQNLDENELTWVVVYRPGVNYQIRLASRDNEEESLEFRHEFAFGPGVGARRQPRTRAARSNDVITAVELTGEATADTDELQSLLALGPGDRFDFAKWQRDHARLEHYYRERGHLAVRVVPRRRIVSDAQGRERLSLEYRIEQGPRTVIEVVGYDLPARVQRAVENARSDAVFASFFTSQAEDVVRAHLTDAGYLRATVTAVVSEQTEDFERVVITVTPGPKTVTHAIEFRGNTALDRLALLDLARERGLVDTAWQNPEPLLAAVRTAYAGRGYLSAEVTARPIAFLGDSATLPIHIVEGPQAHVSSVTFAGLDAIPNGTALAAAGITVGQVYSPGDERSAGVRLRNSLRNLGHGSARVTPNADVRNDGREVALRFEIEEGPRQVVRSVRIEGLESTNRDLVERAIAIEPGQPARPSDVSRTQRQLYERGMFRRADIQFEPVSPVSGVPPSGNDVPVDAIVSVEEFKKYVLRYGISLSNKNTPKFTDLKAAIGVAADLRDRNFLGRGLTAGIGGRWDQDLWSVRSLFTVPRFGRLPVISNVYFTVREEVRSDQSIQLTDDQTQLHLEQRWRPFGGAELTWGYMLDWRAVRFDQVTDAAALPLLEVTGRLASLNLTGVIDRRDSPFDATRGWLHSSSLQWGLQPLGSDSTYVRYLLRQFGYQPLGPVVLAGGFRWGTLRALQGTPPLTAVDLFFTAGGSHTVRGYGEESLSAAEILGVPVGGPELLVLNGELRFPLYKWFKGVLFADAGNTFTRSEGISLSALAVGAGVGLRINTPLAPIRLDLAYPLDRRPGDRRYRIHFSIGQMF